MDVEIATPDGMDAAVGLSIPRISIMGVFVSRMIVPYLRGRREERRLSPPAP